MVVKKPVVKLIGANGNVFNVIGLCKVAARKAGWSKEQIDVLIADLFHAGSYDLVLGMVMERFDVE